eukprot:SAG22_NODE_2814_length_2185_cov_5.070470_3_plen_113_part_00
MAGHSLGGNSASRQHRFGPPFRTTLTITGPDGVNITTQNASYMYQNGLGTLFLSSRENAILQIMGAQNFDPLSLCLTAPAFFLLTLLAFGGGFPSGVFMPTIMCGSPSDRVR